MHRRTVLPEMVAQTVQTENMEEYVPKKDYDELKLKLNSLNSKFTNLELEVEK